MKTKSIQKLIKKERKILLPIAENELYRKMADAAIICQLETKKNEEIEARAYRNAKRWWQL